MKSNTLLVSLLSFSAISCAGQTTTSRHAHEKCEVKDLTEVFANPRQYNDKYFCGKAYFGGNSRTLAFYAAPLGPNVEEYNQALLLVELPESTARKLAALERGAEVRVFGFLDTSHCSGANMPASMEECIPFSHPVYVSRPMVEF
jgi:hypothetical protein